MGVLGNLGVGKMELSPVGGGVHFTGDEEMGMERESYGGRVRDVGPLRHKLAVGTKLILGFVLCVWNRVGGWYL